MKGKGFLLVLVVTFIAATLSRSIHLVMFSTMLLIILAVSFWWSRYSLDGILYQRKFHYKRGFPGEKSSVEFITENHKVLPVTWLRTADGWPDAVLLDQKAILESAPDPEYANVVQMVNLRWYGRRRRTHEMTFLKRGVYPLGPVELESGDPFGLFQKNETRAQRDFLTVFPSILPQAELNLKPEDPFGDIASRKRIYDDPNRPIGVRPYHPEDGFRRVHWPATARTGELQTKVFQPISAQVMMVCLNIATFPERWQGVNPELLERLVNIAATVVQDGIQAGYSVGLLSNGGMAHSDQPYSLAPGRSPQQLAWLLTALAGVMPISTLNFERYLLKAMPTLPYGATLVVVTAIHSSSLDETLLRLKRYRGNLTLISLDSSTPEKIPGVRLIRLPYSPGED